ncbi:MAG TPA: C39 family peptidase [Candidatus Atribacteria bacterium]|nr:C39 family peptidase [Candidatus Atribacteria bacterium]HQE25802.1 C39 family peptidase [Candidatus Atribacteria bacterium]
MRRKSFSFLTIFGLILVILISGCSSSINTPGTSFGISSPPTSGEILDKSVELSDGRIVLDVPFLPQVPPGDWVNTRNCGPACAVMMRAYYFNIQPSPEHIIEADNWLNTRFGLPVNGYNGDWTSIFQIRAWLDSEGVPAKVGMGNLERARAMLSEGKPFLVAVYSNMNPSGGVKHAMLVVGIDSNNIYVNDPGKVAGANNSYPLPQFLSAWGAQGNWYVALN